MSSIWIVAVVVVSVAVITSLIYALLAARRLSKKLTRPSPALCRGPEEPEELGSPNAPTPLALYRVRKAAKFNRQLAKRKRIVQRWKEM